MTPARSWFLGALFGLALYGFTAAPGLVWQDGGDAQVRVALDDFRGPFDLARAHVLQMLLASGLRHGLRLDPAWAANLLSVLAGAVTIANMAALLTLLIRRPLPVLAATLLLACSHTLWQFSTIAETNALVAALLSAELLALQRFAATGRPRFLLLLALLNGLGLANHNVALLSAACYVVIACFLLKRWNRRHAACAALALLCWLIGASPALVLIFREVSGGVTPSAALHSFLVGDFQAQVLNTRLAPSMLLNVPAFVVLNFPSPLLLLLPPGFRPLRALCARPLFATLALLLAVHFLFAARYNVVDQYSFFIPTYCLMTVVLAAGLDRLLHRPLRAKAALAVLCAMLPVAVYAVLPSVARRLPAGLVPIPLRPVPYRDPYAWFLHPWHRGLAGPERFAREVFDTLPPEAILLVDPTLRPPLLYLQIVEGLRRDVQINDGLWQPGRRPAPLDMNRPETFDPYVSAGRVFIASDKPAYTPNYGWILQRYALRRAGHLFQVQLPSPASPPPENK